MNFYCLNNDCGTSILFKPIESFNSIKEVIKVPVYSLKNVFDVFPWDKYEYIEYIKIDAQGADLDILKSGGDYLKERVVYVTAEPENTTYDNISHNNIDNIISYMESQNFINIKHPNTSDPTFINKKYLHLKDTIYISQIG